MDKHSKKKAISDIDKDRIKQFGRLDITSSVGKKIKECVRERLSLFDPSMTHREAYDVFCKEATIYVCFEYFRRVLQIVRKEEKIKAELREEE